jgi:hypothetical protein
MEGDSTVDTNLQKRVILLEALGGDDRNKITAKIFESEVYNDFPMGRLVSK